MTSVKQLTVSENSNCIRFIGALILIHSVRNLHRMNNYSILTDDTVIISGPQGTTVLVAHVPINYVLQHLLCIAHIM